MNWTKLFRREMKASAAAPLLVQWGAHQPRFTPRAYETLADEGYLHDPHVLLGSSAPAHEPLSGVHRVAALIKRWLIGTHHGAVDPRHVDDYLDEFTFRFNRRSSKSRGMLFYRLMQQTVTAAPATYIDIRDNTRRPRQRLPRAVRPVELNG